MLAGLVPDGVTAVALTFTDGRHQLVAVHENGFAIRVASEVASYTLLPRSKGYVTAVNPPTTMPAAPPAQGGPGIPSSLRYTMSLGPSIAGGSAGWCVTIQPVGVGTCGSVPEPGAPIWSGIFGAFSQAAHGVTDIMITTPQVATVRVNGGNAIRTVRGRGLPFGYRSVAVFIPTTAATPPVSGTPGPLSGPTVPDAQAFDARGQQLAQRPVQGYRLNARYWQPPQRPPSGACTMTATGITGLSAQWGHVVTALHRFPRIDPHVLVSCIDTEYYLNRWPLDAAVLLNAADPHRPAPPLPSARAIPGHPGLFSAPGDDHGTLTARRTGRAWLVVAGGSNLLQRELVLDHLRATLPR
jgi:hypothetical protein